MKKMYLIVSLYFLTLSSLTHALEPMETIFTPNGYELNLVKVGVKEGILSVYLMVENKTEERIELRSLYVKQIQYVAGGRKYPVLQDEKNKWLASPQGPSEMFYDVTNGKFRIEPGERQIGWMKFEAPGEGDWPIEIDIPRMLPLTIEKPE